MLTSCRKIFCISPNIPAYSTITLRSTPARSRVCSWVNAARIKISISSLLFAEVLSNIVDNCWPFCRRKATAEPSSTKSVVLLTLNHKSCSTINFNFRIHKRDWQYLAVSGSRNWLFSGLKNWFLIPVSGTRYFWTRKWHFILDCWSRNWRYEFVYWSIKLSILKVCL